MKPSCCRIALLGIARSCDGCAMADGLPDSFRLARNRPRPGAIEHVGAEQTQQRRVIRIVHEGC